MDSRQRASPEQFATLIEFMERNNDISRPQQVLQGRIRSDLLWQELVELLNSVGGGVYKSTEKWKKLWADWKAKTKKKATVIRTHVTGTGGGPNNRLRLTELEERVVALMGVRAVAGQDEIRELGFGPTQMYSPMAEQQQPTTASNIAESGPSGGIENTLLDLGPSNVISQVEPQNSIPPFTSPARPNTPVVRLVTPAPSGTAPPRRAPSSTISTPRRRRHQPQRRRGTETPFERAVHEFVAVEQRRLRFEEESERQLRDREAERDRLQHQLEMQRLQVQAQQDVTNSALVENIGRLAEVGLALLNFLQNRH